MHGKFNDMFAKAMHELGIEVIYGVMGDANMFIVDSFHRLPGTRFVSTANEGGAVLAAAGHAAVSEEVGVATVTHGAIANCVSALLDAARGHHPVVVIAGDTSRADGLHLQNVPQSEIVAPTGAEHRPLRSMETAGLELAAAMRSAATRKGPVVLEIPAELQQADCSMIMPVPLEQARGTLLPSREGLEAAAAMLIGANRPLLVAGRGARGAEQALIALAERAGAPLATTLRGKGLFAADPYHIGIFGTLSNPIGSEVISTADCLLVFGAGLTALTTLKGELLEGKRIIQVDHEPAALGRFYQPTLGLEGDAGATADALVELLTEVEAEPSGYRSERLAERLAEFARQDRHEALAAQTLSLSGVLHRVNELLPCPRTVVVDGGRFSHEALRITAVSKPTDYVHCLNVGHIGMSVGYGIGAALAAPEQPTLVVVGDGGFMLGGLTEFNTAVRHEANLVVLLLNDQAYGAEYYRFVNQDLDPSLTTFQWPSFATIAESLGGRSLTVEQWSDLEALPELLDGSGPLLVEVILDRRLIPDPGAH